MGVKVDENRWDRLKTEGCLSPLHIRSLKCEIEPARLEVFTGATLAKVVRELVVKECTSCQEPFKVERYREKNIHWCQSCRSGKLGGVRGEVTTFSFSSRRRLMRMLNQVKKEISNVSFVTLTYPDEFHPLNLEPERWKRDLRAFEHRFRRAFPAGAFVWRLEVADRKSGEHVGEPFPHFHLLVFNVNIGLLRSFVREGWHEIAGYGSVEHYKVHSHLKTVSPVLSRRGVMGYASKAVGAVMSSELGKTLQAEGKHVGRWWGVAVRKVFTLFLAEAEIFELADKDAVTFLRYFRKYMHKQVLLRWEREGKRWKKPYQKGRSWRSLTVFLDAEWLRENMVKMLSPPGDWCFQATGRRYEEPFKKWAYRTGKLVPELEGGN